MDDLINKAKVLGLISRFYTGKREINDLLDKLHEEVMKIPSENHGGCGGDKCEF